MPGPFQSEVLQAEVARCEAFDTVKGRNGMSCSGAESIQNARHLISAWRLLEVVPFFSALVILFQEKALVSHDFQPRTTARHGVFPNRHFIPLPTAQPLGSTHIYVARHSPTWPLEFHFSTHWM